MLVACHRRSEEIEGAKKCRSNFRSIKTSTVRSHREHRAISECLSQDLYKVGYTRSRNRILACAHLSGLQVVVPTGNMLRWRKGPIRER